MTIHGQLTAEDCRTAQREVFRPYIRKALWLVVIFGTAQLLFVLLSLPFNFLLIPLLWLTLFMIQYAVICRCSPDYYSENFLTDRLKTGLREVKCKPEGISITGPGISRYIELDKDIRSFQTYGEGLLVFAPIGHEIFPRRWFTEEEYAEFQAYLKKGQNWRGWISYLWRS